MHFDDNDSNAETYYYQVTAINTVVGGECESAPAMSEDLIHNFVTAHTDGIDEAEADVNVYPNPTHDQITIEAVGLHRITVTNAFGQTLYYINASSDKSIIDLSQYSAGLYLIRVDTENGNVIRRVSVVK